MQSASRVRGSVPKHNTLEEQYRDLRQDEFPSNADEFGHI